MIEARGRITCFSFLISPHELPINCWLCGLIPKEKNMNTHTQSVIPSGVNNNETTKMAMAKEVPVTKGKRSAKVEVLPPVTVTMEIIEKAARSNELLPDGVHAQDIASFMADRLKSSGSALRDCILAASTAVRMGETFETGVEATIRRLYPSEVTVDNIWSAARRTVPALRDCGIDPVKIPNLYGMREISRVLRDKTGDHHSAVVKAIKEGKSLGKIKELIPAKPRKAGGKTSTPEPAQVTTSAEGIQFSGTPSAKEQLRRCFDLLSRLLAELPAKVSREIAEKHLTGYVLTHKTQAKSK